MGPESRKHIQLCFNDDVTMLQLCFGYVEPRRPMATGNDLEGNRTSSHSEESVAGGLYSSQALA